MAETTDTIAMLRAVIPLSEEVTIGTYQNRVAVSCATVAPNGGWHWLLSAYLEMRSRSAVIGVIEETHQYSHMTQVTDSAEGSVYFRRDDG